MSVLAPVLAAAAETSAKNDVSAYTVVLVPALAATIVFAVFLTITWLAERSDANRTAKELANRIEPPTEQGSDGRAVDVDSAAIGAYLVGALAPIATVDCLREPKVRDDVGKVLARAGEMKNEIEPSL